LLYNHTATTDIYTLSLHDALPILIFAAPSRAMMPANAPTRSSPSMRKAVFGFDNLIFAPFAAAVNNAASDGTKSTCALRALGKRSEEHTSELQSRSDLVCRLLLEK